MEQKGAVRLLIVRICGMGSSGSAGCVGSLGTEEQIPLFPRIQHISQIPSGPVGGNTSVVHIGALEGLYRGSIGGSIEEK